MKLHDRIESREGVLSGKPVIAGTRISVEIILQRLAAGVTIDELLLDYDHICREDIVACLLFAAEHFTAERYNALMAAHV